jgi:hypothetical protein
MICERKMFASFFGYYICSDMSEGTISSWLENCRNSSCQQIAKYGVYVDGVGLLPEDICGFPPVVPEEEKSST